MENKRYTLGLDFGTLSVRGVIADELGNCIAEATCDYPHGVMDDKLPSGISLPARFALQHPSDYLTSARRVVTEAVAVAGISASAVVGVGIDFTGCTMLPVDEELVPLCLKDEFANEPHAYVKLWKHYGAMEEAAVINAVARERGEGWLASYGGSVSPEWLLPKILETANKAPLVYAATYRFVEAADWLTWVLTGEESHSAGFAGYKALWNDETGYPSSEFMEAVSPALSGIVGTKISTKVISVGACAGYLTASGAALLGLCPGAAVSTPCLDAHSPMPALGMDRPGELMLIVGTSGVQVVNATERKEFGGYLGCCKDAIIPGLYSYETGQAAVGDIFDWFVKNCVPASYEAEAQQRGIGIHKLLREKAARLAVGEGGLVALDWHNGNRSPLADPALSSVMLGMTLATRPEHMYRAWLEASVFGTKSIVDNLEAGGVHVTRAVAAGGIALKDELLMQIFADVLGINVEVSASAQAPALGSAAYAAVAAGIYPSLNAAARAFERPMHKVFYPIPENREAYARLYREYKTLEEYFAKGENDAMKRLKGLK